MKKMTITKLAGLSALIAGSIFSVASANNMAQENQLAMTHWQQNVAQEIAMEGSKALEQIQTNQGFGNDIKLNGDFLTLQKRMLEDRLMDENEQLTVDAKTIPKADSTMIINFNTLDFGMTGTVLASE